MKRLGSVMVVLMLAACSGDSEETENQEAVSLEEDNQEVVDNEADEHEVEDNETDTAEEETSTESEATEETDENDDTEIAETEDDMETEESNREVAETPEFTAREFSEEEKQAMNDEFYNWAVERAEIGNLAVTDYYFGHGAAGHGDWYASTPHGDVQAQDLDNPGFDAFDIHAVGGVVFYNPLSGEYGADENTEVESTASGYQTMAVDDTNIHKYMLADNGVVYEHISAKEETSLSSGFGEYNDDGTRGEYTPTSGFEVSGDQEAQNEWQRILSEYQ
ncbi:hypothetical protein [Jeotgalicoccus marinus]|uniref:hypothetical protein n=1 Tax=Jeotgalicoccus marinus TaxID=516700 RepID=UPI000400F762|nr:hypothetical protein [Jeotgalicoccus marinus]